MVSMRVKKCRGPSEPHKITSEVLAYLNELVRAELQLKARQLAARIGKRFKLKVHPRTIEKALKPKANYGRFKLNMRLRSVQNVFDHHLIWCLPFHSEQTANAATLVQRL